MMSSLYLKTLYDKRWFIFGWFLGFAFLGFLMAIFFPAMNQEGALDALMEQMPPALQGMVGDLNNLREFPTYLASQLFDIRVGILGGVAVIILGLGLTVAEEEKGQLRTLSSLPISRDSILLQKYFAMVSILALVTLGMVPGIFIGQVIIDEWLALDVLARLLAMNWLLLVALGSVVFGVGIGFGRRSLAMTVGTVVVAGSFILTTFAQAVDWLQPYEILSIMHYFPAVEVAKSGPSLRDILVLTIISLVSTALCWLWFRKRDIA